METNKHRLIIEQEYIGPHSGNGLSQRIDKIKTTLIEDDEVIFTFEADQFRYRESDIAKAINALKFGGEKRKTSCNVCSNCCKSSRFIGIGFPQIFNFKRKLFK